MCKVHYWEPIYREDRHGKQLCGICAHCKKVVRAEYLIRRLNVYERECEGMEIVSDEQLGEKDE